jgi:hypothetical protein
MESCDKPLAELSIGQGADCIWMKGSNAVSAVFHNPGGATINDWALAVLSLLILLNILFFLLGLLRPRRF